MTRVSASLLAVEDDDVVTFLESSAPRSRSSSLLAPWLLDLTHPRFKCGSAIRRPRS
jgi:hypothetical protein